jgi:hypothetical protein
MFCQPREAVVDVDSALREITDAGTHPRAP